MKQITLGSTGIQTPQNAFGALPVQRVSMDQAVKILQRAYEGGMTFFGHCPVLTATAKKKWAKPLVTCVTKFILQPKQPQRLRMNSGVS